MPALYEANQVGKRESLADLISVVEAQATPFSSMVPKRKKPNQVQHQWQAKSYPKTGHAGVLDGQDATNFTHNAREMLYGISQKVWYLPAVSDFAEESVVAGAPKGEMAEQIADALVNVKRQIEMRCLSNDDQARDNGTTQANETRGMFQWIGNDEQSYLPVPANFRTPSASIISGALDTVTETAFKQAARANYKQRKGTSELYGFVGIDLKNEITNWSIYTDDVSNKTQSRRFSQDANSKALLACIDKLVLDTGEIDLHLASFAWTDPDTGDDTNYTHRSGIFVEMNMLGLAWTRMPRVVKLEYQGGGYKAIVDAIFMMMCDNPLGQMAVKSNSDS